MTRLNAASQTMPETLEETRRRLTPAHTPGVVRFTSIELLSPTLADFSQEAPGSTAKLNIGFFPVPPLVVRVHLFHEASGELVTNLRADFAVISGTDIHCVVDLPEQLPAGLICLVVEGDWISGCAGCELNLEC